MTPGNDPSKNGEEGDFARVPEPEPIQRVCTVEDLERFFIVGGELLAIAGYDGYFKWVGAAWERALGWSPEELTSHPWLFFVHPDDEAATVEEARQLFAGRETVEFENRYRDKKGSWHWLR